MRSRTNTKTYVKMYTFRVKILIEEFVRMDKIIETVKR